MTKEAEQHLSASDLPCGSGPGDQRVASLAIFRESDDLDDQADFMTRCLHAGTKRRLELLNRIFSRCKWEGQCLVWQGPTSGSGRGGSYGRFSFQGATASVHRTVWELVYGPIPPRKQLDHECENRRCCNPFHLQPMTHKKNQKLRDQRRNNDERNIRH